MGQGGTVANNSITSYVNGIRTNGTSGQALPRATPRSAAYIGKSHWPDEYFDCYLDAFRLYDWALSGAEVGDLYRSTNEQLVVDISNRTTPIYHTAPLAAFTFHTQRPGNLSAYGSAYQPLTFNDSRYGIAQFNGRTDYIDLSRFPDDPNPPSPTARPASSCPCAWVGRCRSRCGEVGRAQLLLARLRPGRLVQLQPEHHHPVQHRRAAGPAV